MGTTADDDTWRACRARCAAWDAAATTELQSSELHAREAAADLASARFHMDTASRELAASTAHTDESNAMRGTLAALRSAGASEPPHQAA